MMRSLYSGVAGLKTHQTKMDVIGNNIANVNTIGFKSQSVTFSDVLYQTTQSSTGPNAETGKGGTNAIQIGLGSSVAGMSTSVASAGGAQSTNNPFDLMINGDSLFVVSDGVQNFFTRAGNFTTDANGSLVTSSGLNVMGWKADQEGNILKTTVQPLSIYGAEYKYADPTQTTAATFSGNINKEDESLTAENGSISANVSFYDNLGYEYIVTLQVTQVSDYEYSISAANVTCNGTVIEDADLSALLGETTITFNDADGTINPDTNSFVLNVTSLSNSFSEDITVDMSQVTCFGKDTSLICSKGDLNYLNAGRAVGEMTGVSIGTDGKIAAAYDNGDTRIIGQIVVANFANLAGLEKAGDNLYTATMNSGEFDGIGSDITADGGSFSPGYVEMSNVDLAGEFTDMITTQRGFQANSRIITVSDTMLEELINLKR